MTNLMRAVLDAPVLLEMRREGNLRLVRYTGTMRSHLRTRSPKPYQVQSCGRLLKRFATLPEAEALYERILAVHREAGQQ